MDLLLSLFIFITTVVGGLLVVYLVMFMAMLITTKIMYFLSISIENNIAYMGFFGFFLTILSLIIAVVAKYIKDL